MATLILKCDDEVVREFAAGPMVTVGRLADNTIVVDDPAVSSHHACIFRDGDHIVVEDLQSTNGTFVNDRRVARYTLRNGDVVRVGKHTLRFDELKAAEPVPPRRTESIIGDVNQTMFLDRRQHRALLNRLLDVEAYATTAKTSLSTEKPAVLRVVAGATDQPEYALDRHTSLIGRGTGCVVRLRGWFKPDVAVAITRNRLGYVATSLGGNALINSQRMGERCELKDGDLIQVSGLVLEFRSQAGADSSRTPAPARAPAPAPAPVQSDSGHIHLGRL